MLERRQVLALGALAACSTVVAPRALGAAGGTDAALARLAQSGRDSGSDAILIYRGSAKVFEAYSGPPEPIFLMSCVKSIASLAVGRAIADGKIKGLDQPLYDFFPELNQGRKKAMTVRHVLSMTTGIQNTGSGNEVYAAPDMVRLAVAAELVSAPGVAFDYNNKAVNLISGLIKAATRQPLDDYVRDVFFDPMGIESWNWLRDDAGNASAMADLALYPADFAKFGLLMLQRGQWAGKQLVPAQWVSESGQQSQPYEPMYGRLWWRLPTRSIGVVSKEKVQAIERAGAPRDMVAALTKLVGVVFKSQTEWHQALQGVLPDWEDIAPRCKGAMDSHASDVPAWRYDGFDGVQAEGYHGQYLVVLPDRQLVGVRMIKSTPAFRYNTNRFENFADMVRALA